MTRSGAYRDQMRLKLVLIGIVLLAIPANAAAAVPAPIGEPSGVYSVNKITLTGFKLHRCARCRARIELTEDGLEIKRITSYLKFKGSACNNADPSYLEQARLSGDGTYRARRYEGSVLHVVRGRVSRAAITGHGAITCHPTNKSHAITARFSFRARLTGHDAPAPGAVVHCEAVGRPPQTMFLAVQRDLGCGLAHDVARARQAGAGCGSLCAFEGLACADVAQGRLDPAATLACGASGGTLEVVTLRNCPSSDLLTSKTSLYVEATQSVSCPDAVSLAHINGLCEDEQTTACTQPRGFRCTELDPAVVDRLADQLERCTGTPDARRVVVLAGYSSANG